MSFDGKFFTSSEACLVYEKRMTHLSDLARRCEAVVKSCQGSRFRSSGDLLPESLISYLSRIPDEDFRHCWEGALVHLFAGVPGFRHSLPILGGEALQVFDSEESDEWAFFELRAEAAYRLLAFVLHKLP